MDFVNILSYMSAKVFKNDYLKLLALLKSVKVML